MRAPRSLVAAVLLPGLFCLPAQADQEKASTNQRYTLRYKFSPGETIRWEVVHRAKVRTTVSGTTQTAETVSRSVKAWHVTDVEDDGTATFEHLVESVDMSHKLTGRAEVRYNSQSDKEVPPGFENVAASLGVPLSIVTMDDRGNIVKRERKLDKASTGENDGLMTILLPEGPVAVGESWSLPYEITVPLANGGLKGAVKKVKTQQKYTLAEVSNGIAAIEVATQILTPVHDPAIEAQLIQRESQGTVRFDIETGRVISQQLDLDRRVVGFSGEASSLHYVTRFTEDLIPRDSSETAKVDSKTERK